MCGWPGRISSHLQSYFPYIRSFLGNWKGWLDSFLPGFLVVRFCFLSVSHSITDMLSIPEEPHVINVIWNTYQPSMGVSDGIEPPVRPDAAIVIPPSFFPLPLFLNSLYTHRQAHPSLVWIPPHAVPAELLAQRTSQCPMFPIGSPS